MNTDVNVESLLNMAEGGDSLAAMALHDKAEEDGMLLPWSPRKGDAVFLFTGLFFHCGVIAGENHEYYSLEPNSVTVYETGPYERLFQGGITSQSSPISPPSAIRKACISQIVKWELPDLPRRSDQKPLRIQRSGEPAWFPKLDEYVFFFSSAYYYCGKITGETYSDYCLEKDSVTVFETTCIESFFSRGNCNRCEILPFASVLRKSPISQAVKWDLPRLPFQSN